MSSPARYPDAQATTVDLCPDAGTTGLVILELVDDGVGLPTLRP